MILKNEGVPLPLLISRLPKLNIPLPLLQQSIYTIASPRYRYLFRNSQSTLLTKQSKTIPNSSKFSKNPKKKQLTGSLEKRSSEAGKPKVTRELFKYFAQCSKLLRSANAYSPLTTQMPSKLMSAKNWGKTQISNLFLHMSVSISSASTLYSETLNTESSETLLKAYLILRVAGLIDDLCNNKNSNGFTVS